MRHITDLMQDQTVILARHHAKFVTAPTRWEKFCTFVAYGSVVVGVGVAVFAVTPVHAAGSMAQEVRRVSVSPSIIQFGSKTDNQMKIDNNKAFNNLELEDRRSINRRILEEDKAYYKKLEWQRKHK